MRADGQLPPDSCHGCARGGPPARNDHPGPRRPDAWSNAQGIAASAVIDSEGRLLDSLPWRTAGAIDATLPPPAPPTVFARLGNLIPLLLGFALVFSLVLFPLIFGWRTIFGHDHESVGAQPMDELVFLVALLLPCRSRRWQTGINHHLDQIAFSVGPGQKITEL